MKNKLIIENEKYETWLTGLSQESFSLKPKSEFNYKLIFKPDWVGVVNALLTIKMPYTGDVLEYKIIGTST